MIRRGQLESEEWVDVVPRRLKWKRDGVDLVARRYRIRFIGPERWETTYRGGPISVDRRRSMAMAIAEQHHHEAQRKQQIVGFGVTAVVSLLVAVFALAAQTPLGFFIFVAGVGLFLSFGARSLAASTRNLLDPYRIRERGEPSDWWNHPL